jgi:hypothetical protein
MMEAAGRRGPAGVGVLSPMLRSCPNLQGLKAGILAVAKAAARYSPALIRANYGNSADPGLVCLFRVTSSESRLLEVKPCLSRFLEFNLA